MALASCGGEKITQTVAQVERVRAGVTVTEPSRAAEAVDAVVRLAPGAAVATDDTGRALVVLDHGERVLLDRGTRVRVTSAGALSLDAGRVWVTAAPADDPLAADAARLEAGSATLHLRGVRASVARQGDGATLDVLGGEVAWSSGARQGAVHAGERATLRGAEANVTARTLFDDWTGGLADDLPAGVTVGGAVGLGSVAARRPDEQGAPRWPLAVQRLDARVAVVGDLAITELEETFFNPASDTVEGLYTLTVPRGAVLQRFAVDRRGELVDGFVRERNVAARDYQAQVYQGSTHDPALLEWDAPGSYHARLYPITPGMTRRVLVTYTQWLTPRPDGGRTYRLPLATLGVRVGELRADVDISRSGATEVRATEGARRDDTHVTWLRSDALPSSDFVLDLRGAPPADVSAVRVAGRPSGSSADDRSGFFRVAVRAPEPEARSAADRGVDLAVIVDHSAATDPAARQLGAAFADALARSLHANDRLLVLAGDVGARPVGGGAARLEPVTDAKRQELLEALSRERRGGATDLGAMIEAAHGALDPQRNGAIVYVGDGVATVGESDVAALRARVARMNPRPRFYAVAVGEAPRLDLLAGVAEPSGFAARVERRADVARTAIDLLTHATRPLVRNFRADLGPGVERVYPSEAVDVPAGEALVVVGRYVRDPPARVRVRAMWNGRETTRDLPFTSTVLADHGDLRYRWAAARLDHLLAAGESRAAVVELGTRFGLVTPFTSLYVPSEDEPLPPRNRAQTSDARDGLSVFDLIPLVGCSRMRDEAPSAAPTSASTPAAAPEPHFAREEGGSGARHAGDEGRMGNRAGDTRNARYAIRAIGAASADPSAATDQTAAQGQAAPAETETAANQPVMTPTAAPVAAAPAMPAPPPVVAEIPPVQQRVARPSRSRAVNTGGDALGDIAFATGEGPGGGGSGGGAGRAHRRPTGVHGGVDDLDRTATRDGAQAGEASGYGGLAANADANGVADNERWSGAQEQQPRLARQQARGDGDEAARAAARVLSRCSDAAAVALSERVPLWRERLQARGGASGALAVWAEAKRACELPGQADRVALLRLMVGAVGGVDGQLALYRGLRREPGARAWVRDVILRTLARTGELARASELGLARLDAETLTAALAHAATPAERLNVLRALVRRFPDDLDLSLLLLDAAAGAADAVEVRRTGARLREDPRADARVRTAVGEALLSIGDEADARRAFSEIVEFAPDDPWARRRLGDIALAHGWALEAYRQFQTLAAALNDAPEILLRLAWAARGQGRLDEALRLAERVTTQTAPGAQGTVSEAAAAWIAAELALAGSASDVPADQLAGLRARWRRSPAARSAGAVRAVLRWNHPDDEAELWVRAAGEPTRRADLVASLVPLETSVWSEAPEALEVELRRGGGARPRGDAEVVVIWNEGTPRERVARQQVHFDPDHPRFVFAARDGALTAVALPATPVVPAAPGGAR
ncbi:MAG: VIT domain-containing protein [Polyangiales bacterium]